MRLGPTAVVGTAVLLFGLGGLAAAGITPSGDTNGTVTVGQVLTFSVADSFTSPWPGGTDLSACDANGSANALGSVAVGPLSASTGGTGWLPLAITCTGGPGAPGVWNYDGSVTVTVPADAPSAVWASVAVHEQVPNLAAGQTGCQCYYDRDYNGNYTYQLVTAGATTSATSPVGTTTANGATTTTAATTVSTATVVSTTVPTSAPTTSPTTSTSSGSSTPTPKAPSPPTLSGPRLVYVAAHQRRARIELTSSDTRDPQRLCWRLAGEREATCVHGRGVWVVTVTAAPGDRLFSLALNDRVVSRLVVTVRVRR